mmetsp:Transcript_31499/g.64073  ORF Transcript_31499/g.64073 Transcript_31499/m.64073 type:complete len:238 (+) Transcript_31499:313-1026(+)
MEEDWWCSCGGGVFFASSFDPIPRIPLTNLCIDELSSLESSSAFTGAGACRCILGGPPSRCASVDDPPSPVLAPVTVDPVLLYAVAAFPDVLLVLISLDPNSARLEALILSVREDSRCCCCVDNIGCGSFCCCNLSSSASCTAMSFRRCSTCISRTLCKKMSDFRLDLSSDDTCGDPVPAIVLSKSDWELVRRRAFRSFFLPLLVVLLDMVEEAGIDLTEILSLLLAGAAGEGPVGE